MVKKQNTKEARKKIRARIRAKISGTHERPRLAVFRSANHIYAQLIDDTAGVTLAAASTWKSTGKRTSMPRSPKVP